MNKHSATVWGNCLSMDRNLELIWLLMGRLYRIIRTGDYYPERGSLKDLEIHIYCMVWHNRAPSWYSSWCSSSFYWAPLCATANFPHIKTSSQLTGSRMKPQSKRRGWAWQRVTNRLVWLQIVSHFHSLLGFLDKSLCSRGTPGKSRTAYRARRYVNLDRARGLASPLLSDLSRHHQISVTSSQWILI